MIVLISSTGDMVTPCFVKIEMSGTMISFKRMSRQNEPNTQIHFSAFIPNQAMNFKQKYDSREDKN